MKKYLLGSKGTLFLLGLFLGSSLFAQNEATTAIESYLKSHNGTLQLDESLLTAFRVEKSTTNKRRGFVHHYVNQTHNGLSVLNGTAVFVENDGEMLLTGNRLIQSFGEILPSNNPMPIELAIAGVLNQLGQERTLADYEVRVLESGKYLLKHNSNENFDIPVETAYFYKEGILHFVYDLNIQTEDNLHWWSLSVDANSGNIVHQVDWIVSCSFENCSARKGFSSEQLEVKMHEHSWMMAPAPPPQNDTYRVFAIPLESPIHGPSTLEVGPFNSLASPFGWHDDNGIAGEEYTITRGNNVYATEDMDDDNQPGYSPDGGSSLVFDFTVPHTQDYVQWLDASITQLFYMNNIMHDVYYQYGFDEESGNFQENNYGRGGIAGDYVNAQAQDGSGLNNANFGTPPDGSNPRMQMYIWEPDGTPRMFYIDAPSNLAGRYGSGSAGFGPGTPSTPLSGELVFAYDSVGNDPFDGCTQILSDVTGKIAFVRRGGCSFTDKVENCEAAGAIAVIVMNNSLGDPGDMTGTPNNPINIPSLQIARNLGVNLIGQLESEVPVQVTLFDDGWSGFTDSDFDNGIIAHEYGHGISNRLTGGPGASGCLSNEDQMGEGWSDWVGLMLTIEPGDQGSDRRGIGVYVQNEPTDGDGIRPTPYSTDFSINGATYGLSNNQSITRPHGVGYVWASALWDLTWNFIEVYGYDDDIYNGTGGNNIVMELVLEGMKLQPCNPGSVDGRDAIIQADQLLNNGANFCLIWNTFAKRGLGEQADQGSAFDRFDQQEDFTIPMSCGLGLTDAEQLEFVRAYPNPTEDLITIQTIETNKIQSVRVLDMNGRVLYEATDLNAEQLELDFSSYHTGIYLVDMMLEKGQLVKRISRQ